ncbi:MAG: hypothetical protein RJA70_966, partial [Pseudomonadota bacterium]
MVSTKSNRVKLDRKHLPLVVTATLLVVMYASGMVFYDSFRTVRFFVDLIKGNAAVGICAVGMTFVILAGGIDLSVGSVIAATTTLIATLVLGGMDPFLSFGLGVLFATAFGAIGGVLIYRFSLPAFLVTLAGLFFARGFAFLLSMDPLSISHPTFEWIMDDLG